jgi:hypothetical protein
MKNGDIIIPKFQRGYVWSLREASRFIESLLFGLPVPNIFLSVEPDNQRLLVVDGRQRLSTLTYFYEGIWPLTKREFAIKGTGEKGKYEGFTYRTLPEADRRKLDNALLRASIIRQEQPSEDDSAAIYHGKFSDLIGELNKNRQWRDIYGPENRFMRDQELILRFFAFYFHGSSYTAPMKEFLNRFMAWDRNLTKVPGDVLSSLFASSIAIVYEAIGKQAFRPSRAINTAVFDAVMVGIARRLATGGPLSKDSLRAIYANLLSDEGFLEITQHSTGHPTNVEKRLRIATEAFASAV